MKYLEFEVKNMAISRAQGDKINPVSGSVNYFGVHFIFDEEFGLIPGTKSVEFYKNKKNIRRDLVDGGCVIPKEMLVDKTAFEIRVISGSEVATPWVTISVTESGSIQPDIPEEELPESLGYVKTQTGDSAVAMLRKGANGLEFSQNGEDWEGGVNGIPDVPKTPKDATYVRKNGDWVQFEAPEQVEGLTGTAVSVEELATDADLTAVVAKINEIIGALKDRGVLA